MNPSIRKSPKCYTLLIEDDSLFYNNRYEGNYGFVQLSNVGNYPVLVRLNQDNEAVFTLYPDFTQIFNDSDLDIWSIEIQADSSGGGDCLVDMIVAELS